MSEANGTTIAGAVKPKRIRRTYAPDIRPKALEMHRAGKSSDEITAALGVTAPALRDWIIRERNGGVLPPKKSVTKPVAPPAVAARAPVETEGELRATIAALRAELVAVRAERETLEQTVRILARR